jgi:hypothetical protein
MDNYSPAVECSVTMKVDYNKFIQFHDIVKACNGRYIHNPIFVNNMVNVSVEVPDYLDFMNRWHSVNDGIKEIPQNNKWYVKYWRRFKLFFKF